MDKEGFKAYLISTHRAENAIVTRIRHAIEVERILGRDLDEVVASDEEMYNALIRIKEIKASGKETRHAPVKNAVRRYYVFRNGVEFPHIDVYERRRQIRNNH